MHSAGSLDAEAVVRFSEGIQGTVRVLLDQREPRCVITIPPATAAEHDFLVNNFPILFPPEHPLDFRAFQSLAKLVLVRRIVKALVTHHGLYRVQRDARAHRRGLDGAGDVVVRGDEQAKRRAGDLSRSHGGAEHGGGGGRVPAGFDRGVPDELVVAEGGGSALEEEGKVGFRRGWNARREVRRRTIANF